MSFGASSLAVVDSGGGSGGGSLQLVSKKTLTASTTLEWTALTGDYRYILYWNAQEGNTGACNMLIEINGDTTVTNYRFVGTYNRSTPDDVPSANNSNQVIYNIAQNERGFGTIEIEKIEGDRVYMLSQHLVNSIGSPTRGEIGIVNSSVCSDITSLKFIWSQTMTGSFSLFKIER